MRSQPDSENTLTPEASYNSSNQGLCRGAGQMEALKQPLSEACKDSPSLSENTPIAASPVHLLAGPEAPSVETQPHSAENFSATSRERTHQTAHLQSESRVIEARMAAARKKRPSVALKLRARLLPYSATSSFGSRNCARDRRGLPLTDTNSIEKGTTPCSTPTHYADHPPAAASQTEDYVTPA